MNLEDAETLTEKREYVNTLKRRRALLKPLVPSFLLDRFYSPDEITTFEDRRASTEATFDETTDRIESLVDEICQGIERAEKAPNPLDVDLTSVRVRFDRLTEAYDTLSDLDEEYLSADEREHREDLDSRVTELEMWLEGFDSVGRKVNVAATRLETVTEDLAEYGYDSWSPDRGNSPDPPSRPLQQYMERRTKKALKDLLIEADEAIKAGYDIVRDSGLGERYLDDLDGVADDHRRLDAFLERYNDWYVLQECTAHETLFTDIDAAGHDLSEEQQKAVVRDDKYNLVVAGAGSGKTVTLAHRAAYLTQRRDRVLPKDILAITYTNNAAEVMESRLARKFGITDARIGTFHSVGKDIITEETGREPEVITTRDRQGIIKKFIRSEMDRENSDFRREFIRLLRHYYNDVGETEFDEKVERVEEDPNPYRTLCGEEARSLSEKRIADFLFLNQVEYEYRIIQDWFEDTPGAGQYRPTFYLPRYDVVISHRPIDGSAAPTEWSDFDEAVEYRSFVTWERERLTERTEIDFVETYEFEESTNCLERALEDRLVNIGVPLEEMEYEELIENAYDAKFNEYQLYNLFGSFISNAKQLNLTPEEVEDRIIDDTPKTEAFGRCASTLFRIYAMKLHEIGAIDFPDMLHRAADLMQSNPEKYTDRYDQILVDEFQDISAAEVRLLKCFVTPENDTKLFCVGDDWQSIYSFAGSNVDYFIDFADYFDDPTRTNLTANYRCPATVVKAGDTLIEQNDRQLAKTTQPKSGTDTTISTHDLDVSPGNKFYRHRLIDYTVNLIARYLDAGAAPNEILVLSRSNSFYQDLSEACDEQDIKAATRPEDEEFPEEYVRLYSVHKSKGDEAEHVIIIHAVEDIVGFPSQVEDSALLEPVRLQAEEDTVAEERRLFYVALTRTTSTLDIVSAAGKRSRFLDDIEGHLHEAPTVAAIGNHTQRTDVAEAKVATLFDAAGPVEQTGLIADWSGKRKFTIFDADETQLLEEGAEYHIENARVDEHEGDYSLVLDERADVRRCEPQGEQRSTQLQ